MRIRDILQYQIQIGRTRDGRVIGEILVPEMESVLANPDLESLSFIECRNCHYIMADEYFVEGCPNCGCKDVDEYRVNPEEMPEVTEVSYER